MLKKHENMSVRNIPKGIKINPYTLAPYNPRGRYNRYATTGHCCWQGLYCELSVQFVKKEVLSGKFTKDSPATSCPRNMERQNVRNILKSVQINP